MWDNAGAMRRITRWLTALVLLMLLGAAGVWLYHSPYFPVKQVKIEGDLKRVSTQELQTVAQRYIRGNIFSADLNGAQKAFQALPWIDKAQVRRRLPDVVEIHRTEREPVARWRAAGLVDANGNIFQAATTETFPEFDGQPGTAKTMVAHYQEFSGLLKPAGLSIAKLEYTPRSARSVVLDNGITVRLGREHENARLQQFAAVWPGILRAQQSGLAYVDMRYKDGFAVRECAPSEMPSETAASVADHHQQ